MKHCNIWRCLALERYPEEICLFRCIAFWVEHIHLVQMEILGPEKGCIKLCRAKPLGTQKSVCQALYQKGLKCSFCPGTCRKHCQSYLQYFLPMSIQTWLLHLTLSVKCRGNLLFNTSNSGNDHAHGAVTHSLKGRFYSWNCCKVEAEAVTEPLFLSVFSGLT